MWLATQWVVSKYLLKNIIHIYVNVIQQIIHCILPDEFKLVVLCDLGEGSLSFPDQFQVSIRELIKWPTPQ